MKSPLHSFPVKQPIPLSRCGYSAELTNRPPVHTSTFQSIRLRRKSPTRSLKSQVRDQQTLLRSAIPQSSEQSIRRRYQELCILKPNPSSAAKNYLITWPITEEASVERCSCTSNSSMTYTNYSKYQRLHPGSPTLPRMIF